MSAYEQKIEPPDVGYAQTFIKYIYNFQKRWQYILFAAEPYETIAFKVPSREVDKSDDRFWSVWNKDTKQVAFRHVYTP